MTYVLLVLVKSKLNCLVPVEYTLHLLTLIVSDKKNHTL